MFTPFKQLAERGIYWFQKTISKRLHDHSFSSIIYDMSFDSHWAHLKSCAKFGVRVLVICLPNHTMLLFILNYFFLYVVNQVRPLHLLTFGLIHCVCGQLLDPMGIHLLCCVHCGERLHPMMLFGMRLHPLQKMQDPWCCLECIYIHCKRCKISHFVRANPCFFIIFSSILLLMNEHCSIVGWYLHIGGCCHCQPHSNKFGITRSSFPWCGCKNGYLDTRRTLSWPLLNKHVSPSCHKSFWVSSLSSWQFSLFMC